LNLPDLRVQLLHRYLCMRAQSAGQPCDAACHSPEDDDGGPGKENGLLDLGQHGGGGAGHQCAAGVSGVGLVAFVFSASSALIFSCAAISCARSPTFWLVRSMTVAPSAWVCGSAVGCACAANGTARNAARIRRRMGFPC